MFLTCFPSLQHIIKCVLDFIENHSVLVGVITSVIASSLWLKKFLKQKRAEAFFGFYAKLSLRLKSLRTMLAEKGQLNISDVEKGNIYSLIYTDNCLATICPSYTRPTDGELKLFKVAADELKGILLGTESNVYPPGAKQKKWYESQYILLSFCEFIANDEYHNVTNEARYNSEGELKHIKKCTSLVAAMNYIQKSIENAKY